MREFGLTIAFVGLILLGLGTAGWYGKPGQMVRHGRWSDRVRQDLESLARKRPPDVGKGQWEFVVGWTLNLHANCGSIWSSVTPDWRDGFADELERRLAGPVTLADIDWIWDEYVAHTRYGRGYSDRWRPTKSDEFESAEPGNFGVPVD